MKILVVDDEIRIRKGLKKLINQFNNKYEVKVSSNGIDAFEIVKIFRPNLIFLDIRMPYMSGLEFAKKVKEQYSETLIVIVSGHAEFDYAKESVSIGVLDYVLKPVMINKLTSVLENAEKEFEKICFAKEKSTRYFETKILEIIEHRSDCSLDEILKTKGTYRLIYGKYLNAKGNYNYYISEEKKHEIIKKIKMHFKSSKNTIGFFKNNDLIMIIIDDDESDLKNQLENIHCEFLELHISDFYDLKDPFYKNYEDLLRSKSKDTFIETLKNCDDNGITNKMIRYIEENYSKNIKLSDISDSVYMHSSYVSKLFKKNTGMNLSDYITNHRIKIAKELLCDPQYKIYEVAYKVGFNGPKYFNKVFKSKTGMTPLEFRNRNIDNQYVK
jgi:two-component system response regulator YesN